MMRFEIRHRDPDVDRFRLYREHLLISAHIDRVYLCEYREGDVCAVVEFYGDSDLLWGVLMCDTDLRSDDTIDIRQIPLVY